MTDRLIRPEHWQQFCYRFTCNHRGWLVTFVAQGPLSEEAGAPEPGAAPRTAPLRSLTVWREGGDTSIAVAVGDEQRPELHVISRAVLLRVERTAGGAERLLKIRSADGELTKMQLLTPHYPRARSTRRHQPAAIAIPRPDRRRSVRRGSEPA